MSLDLSDTFVVGISSTALFDMTESDSAFRVRFSEDRETAVAEYRDLAPVSQDTGYSQYSAGCSVGA